MSPVVILDSGVANLASVRAAFGRLGAETLVTADPAVAASAVRLVLPGVGAFGTAAEALRSYGLDTVVREAVTRETPLLAICLGLQVLCEASEEAPGVPGLGLIPARCRRLPAGVRVPHLGWNRVDADPRCRVVASGEAAFANSYCLDEAPSGWASGWTTHGKPFVAALERASLAACQFHPELSGAWGLDLLRRWLTGGASGESDDGAAPSAAQRDVGRVEAARASGPVRRLVPCLDVRDGRVVKGVRFQDLRDAGDPAERAAAYEAQGADEIVLLDIAASPGARKTRIDTVRKVRAMLGIPLTVGGGVRGTDDARRLLAAGADKVSVNTAAVQRPELITELATEFGSQCTVVAIDARRTGDGWEVLVNGGQDGTGSSPVDWAERVVVLGGGEILLTSWDRDGTRAGCDLELLRAVSNAVSVPVIASGGVGSRGDVMDAIAAGADAVLAASIFHDGSETVAGLKADLALRGVPVRT